MRQLNLVASGRTASQAVTRTWFREIVIVVLVLALLITPLSPALRVLAADPVVLDGTESAWAKPELELAYTYGLTYPTRSTLHRPGMDC